MVRASCLSYAVSKYKQSTIVYKSISLLAWSWKIRRPYDGTVNKDGVAVSNTFGFVSVPTYGQTLCASLFPARELLCVL